MWTDSFPYLSGGRILQMLASPSARVGGSSGRRRSGENRQPSAGAGKAPTRRVAGQELPLTLATPGRPVQIIGIQGDGSQEKRLAEMGLFPNARVLVSMSNRTGPVIVQLGTTRLALSRKAAEKVWVIEA